MTNLRLPGQYDERLLASVGLQGPYYNWNRWYLPGVGRYLELDPVASEGGLNGGFTPEWYSYAAGNPLTYTDPDGRNPVAGAAGGAVVCGPVCAAVGAAIGAGAVWVAACTATNTCPWSRPICRDTPWAPPSDNKESCEAEFDKCIGAGGQVAGLDCNTCLGRCISQGGRWPFDYKGASGRRVCDYTRPPGWH